jgi:hypothetical protein
MPEAYAFEEFEGFYGKSDTNKVAVAQDNRENLVQEFDEEYEKLKNQYPDEMRFMKDFIIGVLIASAFDRSERWNMENALTVIQDEAQKVRGIFNATNYDQV